MKTVYTPAHERHRPPTILTRGVVVPHWEVAGRAEELLASVQRDGHEVVEPADYGRAPRAAVHDPGYLAFLESAWIRWQKQENPTPAVQPYAHPGRHMHGRPTGIDGQAGYYMATGSAPIVEGSWEAAVWAAHAATHAARLVLDGEGAASALCRPPGHHAFSDLGGGFCYLNNVAIAADYMRRERGRVAILDFDVHHGNGTQGIFWRRRDVLFVSLHGDPSDYFPFFAGYANEIGEGDGLGFNLNLPLAPGADDAAFLDALDRALEAVRHFAPEALLVSVGFDAFEADPIGVLRVTTPGFGEIGRRIGAVGLPTVLVQEGGYNLDALGANLSAFLGGFAGARG